MAYDSQSDRVILFGGQYAGGTGGCYGPDDTWAYDFDTKTWSNMEPVSKPPTLTYPAMAYDSQSDRVILFGGCNFRSFLNNTWAYDFESNTWTDMDPAVKPPARVYHAMAYDAQSDRMILFGGYDGGSVFYNDTWAYDFNTNTWTNMTRAREQPARYLHAMAYDSQSDRVILFGGSGTAGYLNDTRAYDFETNTWTDMAPAIRPPARFEHAMAYDSQSDRVILFGGSGNAGLLNDAWAYDFDTNTWRDMNPTARPPARYFHAMAYDSQSDRVILLGGLDDAGAFLNDTWAYDFRANMWTWTYLSPTPPARYGHAMAYDSQSDRVILFGGHGNANYLYLNDTWAYDFESNTWTDMAPAVKPPARLWPAMAYDSQSDRIVMLGGADGSNWFNDTWAYDFNTNTWTDTASGPEPPARVYHAMAYDSQSDRVILFGGYDGAGAYRNDTWAYDFETNTWTDVSPVVSPPVRTGPAMAYDSGSDRVIVFGGCCSGFGYPVNDTWAYDFNSNTWTDIAPDAKPPARYYHAMAYDSQSDRVILFGGAFGYGFYDDTWAYDLEANSWTNEDVPLPLSAPQVFHVTAGNAQVTLTWQAPASNGGSPITGYHVYRGTAPGGLTLLSSLGDVLSYQDLGVTNGVTYLYQVTAVTAAGEGPRSSEVSATPRTQPSAARNLVATPGASRVDLTWDAPVSNGGSPVTGYAIYRGTTPGGAILLTTLGNVLTYADGTANSGVYYYQVAALNLAGEGPRSNEASATLADSIPPTATVASLANNTVVNSTTVTLTGTASDDVAVAKVEVSLDGATWVTASGTTSWSATLALHEGLNTIYVRTTDTSGNVSISTITVTVDLAVRAPGGVSVLTVNVVGGIVVTAAMLAVVSLSSSVSAAASSSIGSGTLTGKRAPLPWKRALRFLRRRRRTVAQVPAQERLLHGSSFLFEGLKEPSSSGKPAPKVSKVFPKVAPSLGLEVRGPWLFGRYRGFPVAVEEDGGALKRKMFFQLALTPEAVPLVTAAITEKGRVASLGLKAGAVGLDPSVVELLYVHKSRTRPKPALVASLLECLSTLAGVGGPALGNVCERCRTNPAGDVFLVNGLPAQLCAADFEDVRARGEQAEATAKARRPAYAKGLGLGVVGALLGAGIWAAIGIATGFIFSLAAFGISILIAALLARGAGLVTTTLAALMVLLTMLSIFVGDVLWVGVVTTGLGGTLDVRPALDAYLAIIRRDPTVLFSYVFGLIGITTSIRYLAKAARRARKSFVVIR